MADFGPKANKQIGVSGVSGVLCDSGVCLSLKKVDSQRVAYVLTHQETTYVF